jgi:peptidoglycan/LPS O-acetylase OafA/YrhL
VTADTRTASPGYLPFIDGLRAVAVLGVICFHFNLGIVTGGYVGVDVFFVLSGYLITNLIEARLQSRNFSFAQFYERRARRILPGLLLMGFLSAMAALVLFVPHDLREFSTSLWGTAFFYSNVLFEQAAGYFAAPLSTIPLLHTWSLAVEEQFYLLFPPLLYGIHAALRNSPRARWLAAGILFVASLSYGILLMGANPARAFYLLPPRAWELLAGGLIALLPSRAGLPRLSAELLSVVGAICIGGSFVLFDRNTPFPGTAALLPCLGTVLVIVSNVDNRTWLGALLAQRSLAYIGLISYGLYLYHWPILTFARYYLDRELNTNETVAALVGTLALAMLSFHGIENPLRSGVWLKSRGRVFAVAACGLAALGLAGIVGVNMDGFPARFSGAALAYAQGERDRWPWAKCMPALERLTAKDVCRVGVAAAAPAFLVWGDSHAAALAPGVDSRAKTLGLAGWVVGYSRCPSLLGAAPMRHAQGDFPCAAIADKVMALIRDQHIRHVLLVSRWDTYISGWERGGVETAQDLTISYTDGGVTYTGAEAFTRALDQTVRRLQAMDVDVWLMEQVPPQLVLVPSALAKAVYLGRDPLALRRPLADVEIRRAAAEAAFNELHRIAQVSFIDPAKTFCPNREPCAIAAQGHALYEDNNHLTAYGAVWSRNMLDPFFSSTIR